MEKPNTDRLIDRIDDAKDWLEKAKTEYRNSNPERGGLILNLAQAEVKHAWELSHQQYVSKSVTPLNREQPHRSNLKYILPIAASLVLVTGLGVGVRMSGVLSPFAKSKPVLTVQTSSGPKALRKTRNVADNKAQRVPVSETRPSDEVVAQIHPTPSSIPVIQPTAGVKQNNTPVGYTDSASNRTASNMIDEKPALKAVSKLSIDEDALTKEASHSLRIGK
ncbi:MAG TPA: hypothetical protein DDW50_09285 [Firmicutes bacterium]|jgi:hypothetical protein|nr:hypothetical protein [Bacillota bacterium]